MTKPVSSVIFDFENSRCSAHKISDKFEVEKRRDRNSSKGALARFETNTFPAKIKPFSPAGPFDFKPGMRRECKEKSIVLDTTSQKKVRGVAHIRSKIKQDSN